MECGLRTPAGCSVECGRGVRHSLTQLVERDIGLCLDGVFWWRAVCPRFVVSWASADRASWSAIFARLLFYLILMNITSIQ